MSKKSGNNKTQFICFRDLFGQKNKKARCLSGCLVIVRSRVQVLLHLILPVAIILLVWWRARTLRSKFHFQLQLIILHIISCLEIVTISNYVIFLPQKITHAGIEPIYDTRCCFLFTNHHIRSDK